MEQIKSRPFGFSNSTLFLLSLLFFIVLAVTTFASATETKQVEPTPKKSTPSNVVESINYPEGVFFTSTASQVPFDAPAPVADSGTQITNLATFAWQEFIALNWPSSYSSNPPERGTPSPTQTILDFAVPSNTGELVWQTYKHRVEVYPEGAEPGDPDYSTSFDSPPQYNYLGGDPSGPIYECGAYDATTKTWAVDTSSQKVSELSYFNNLDETSEINLATLFTTGDPDAAGAVPTTDDVNELYIGLPGQPRRFIYEAKANRTMFDYVVDNAYYDSATRTAAQMATYTAVRDDAKGGIAPCPNDDSIICFPPGYKTGISTPDSDENDAEGTILVKATWKQLTASEYSSGRFVVAPIIRYRNYNPNTVLNSETSESDNAGDFCYETIPATPTATSQPYGLVGLHIIHKTTNYPSFVFATFEQVDNLNAKLPNNGLFYYNRNIASPVNEDRQTITSRAHPVSSQVNAINDTVHNQLRSLLSSNNMDTSSSPWLYYNLIGVQGAATDSENSGDTDFYLANIVTETNQILRSFSGTLDNTNGTIDPQVFNIHKGATTFIGGGCKGCHGNAQVGPAPNTVTSTNTPRASDFSFITQNAPFGAPDAVNQPLFKGQAELIPVPTPDTSE